MSTNDSGPKLPTGADLMRKIRLEPDPWQVDVLESGHPRVLLNCCRQAGKSTAVAYLALAEALYNTRSLVLLLSRCQRQSAELFRIVRQYAALLGRAPCTGWPERKDRCPRQPPNHLRLSPWPLSDRDESQRVST